MGTYTSTIRPDEAASTATDRASPRQTTASPSPGPETGLGNFGPGGSVSYRGMLFLQTTSTKLAALNNTCAAFEYEVDPSGQTVSKMWEWK